MLLRKRITDLDRHPNRIEIDAVLTAAPHLRPHELAGLAAAWRNTPAAAAARHRALSPDCPLVLDALVGLDQLQRIYAEDLLGGDRFPLPPDVVRSALAALGDALAGAFARPVLHRGQYAVLLGPWWAALPAGGYRGPRFGPQTRAVELALAVLPRLAARCHQPVAAALWTALADGLDRLDHDLRDHGRRLAWEAAVRTNRYRLWDLAGLRGDQALGRRCPRCRVRPDQDEEDAVLGLVLDAAGALLVRDVLDRDVVELLADPLIGLAGLRL